MFDISLFAAKLEKPKIGISGKELNIVMLKAFAKENFIVAQFVRFLFERVKNIRHTVGLFNFFCIFSSPEHNMLKGSF